VSPDDERDKLTVVQVVLTSDQIEMLIRKGYLEWPQRADPLAISKAVKKLIRDFPAGN
jgi:hypothetical protein